MRSVTSNSNKYSFHLTFSYFLESTGLVEVFRALFKSYLQTDEILKLDSKNKEDEKLIEKLDEVIQYVYPIEHSSIAHDIGIEQLRYNAYWRLYGYTIKGKDTGFSKVSSSYTEFNKDFETIIINILEGIFFRDITTLPNISNSEAVADLLYTFTNTINNHTYNKIPYITQYWGNAIYSLLILLDDNHLFNDRLSLVSKGRDQRLMDLGIKLNIPVASTCNFFFILADQIEQFFMLIENIDWSTNNPDRSNVAANLFEKENEGLFKGIANSWKQVTVTKDLVSEALKEKS